jgi:hypothetical protein
LVNQKFQIIEDYIASFAGIHVKKLTINSGVKVDQSILQKLLNFLPNLTALDIGCVESVNGEVIKWDLKSTKIERALIRSSVINGRLLEPLEKCQIKELAYFFHDKETPADLQKFLRIQAKTLKKFSVYGTFDFNFMMAVKDLRLEHLDYVNSKQDRISLEFLKKQPDLKSLKLVLRSFSPQNLRVVCELTNLESLRLSSHLRCNDRLGLNSIHKLQKLKKLEVGWSVVENMLDHLKFGVFNDLEELDARFEGVSVKGVRQIKQITPNLKKLVIWQACSNTFPVFMESLEKLETLRIVSFGRLWKPAERVYPKIKYLELSPDTREHAAQFRKMFPNLVNLYKY